MVRTTSAVEAEGAGVGGTVAVLAGIAAQRVCTVGAGVEGNPVGSKGMSPSLQSVHLSTQRGSRSQLFQGALKVAWY